MTKFVVDASVAVKWYLTEEHSSWAERLLAEQHERIAPELLLVEAAQVFIKRQRRGEISASGAHASLAALANSIELRESASLVTTALDVALTHQRSAYDALYVVLAIREGCPLVTADRRLYNALAATDLAATMLWIEDVPAASD